MIVPIHFQLAHDRETGDEDERLRDLMRRAVHVVRLGSTSRSPSDLVAALTARGRRQARAAAKVRRP